MDYFIEFQSKQLNHYANDEVLADTWCRMCKNAPIVLHNIHAIVSNTAHIDIRLKFLRPMEVLMELLRNLHIIEKTDGITFSYSKALIQGNLKAWGHAMHRKCLYADENLNWRNNVMI